MICLWSAFLLRISIENRVFGQAIKTIVGVQPASDHGTLGLSQHEAMSAGRCSKPIVPHAPLTLPLQNPL